MKRLWTFPDLPGRLAGLEPEEAVRLHRMTMEHGLELEEFGLRALRVLEPAPMFLLAATLPDRMILHVRNVDLTAVEPDIVRLTADGRNLVVWNADVSLEDVRKNLETSAVFRRSEMEKMKKTGGN